MTIINGNPVPISVRKKTCFSAFRDDKAWLLMQTLQIYLDT